MHPTLDRRNQRIYTGMWIALALALALYVIAIEVLHAPRIVALLFAVLPGITVLVLCCKIRPTGFRVTGCFRLNSGETITRTIPMYLPDKSDDETFLIAAGAFLQQLQTSGHQFPEGTGRLVELLGKPDAAHKRLILQGDFQMANGEVVTRTVSCRLATKVVLRTLATFAQPSRMNFARRDSDSPMELANLSRQRARYMPDDTVVEIHCGHNRATATVRRFVSRHDPHVFPLTRLPQGWGGTRGDLR